MSLNHLLRVCAEEGALHPHHIFFGEEEKKEGAAAKKKEKRNLPLLDTRSSLQLNPLCFNNVGP